MKTMQVERRSRYGRSCMLPVNPAAQVLAEIAGTIEVRPADIVRAAQLGFTVVRIDRRADGTTIEVETLAVPS